MMFGVALALTVLPVPDMPEGWEPPPATVHHDVGRDVQERDAIGTFANLWPSEHVVIKWGPDLVLDPEDVANISDAFEESWALFVDERGMAPPRGSDEWLLNVYIANSGAPSPSIEPDVSGYFTIDHDGMPMIVMARDQFSAWSSGRDTATHELFHALQNALYSFPSDGWKWFSEASATWSQEEVWDPSSASRRVPAYATSPHRPVGHYSDDDSDWFARTRRYGAFLFLRFLTERLGDDPTLIEDTLLRDEEFALDALLAELEERGEDPGRAFGDFAVANATWAPYERGDAYAMSVLSSPHDGYLSARAGSLGRKGWRWPQSDRLASVWGWDLVRVDAPETGILHARFRSLAPCDVRSWVHVVLEGPDGIEVIPLTEGDRAGGADIPVGGEEFAYLAMAFTGAPRGGSFSYQYVMQVNGDPVGEPPAPGWSVWDPECTEWEGAAAPALGAWSLGCGVSGAPSRVGPGALLAALLLALHRRRRPKHCAA